MGCLHNDAFRHGYGGSCEKRAELVIVTLCLASLVRALVPARNIEGRLLRSTLDEGGPIHICIADVFAKGMDLSVHESGHSCPVLCIEAQRVHRDWSKLVFPLEYVHKSAIFQRIRHVEMSAFDVIDLHQ